MRIIISSIQQYLKLGTISEINHVSTKDQLGDILTKRGVSNERIMNAVSKGSLVFQ